MSSFNINGPGNKPQITEAQSMMNNGGGGNTGYLASGRKKKDKKKDEEIDPRLLEGEIEDKFERQEDEYEDDDDYYNTDAAPASSKNKQDDKPKHPIKDVVKDTVFGLINKVNGVSKKPENNKNDDNGGDFLSLSKNI